MNVIFYAWNLFLISSLIDFGKKNIINNKMNIAKAMDKIEGQVMVIISSKIRIIGNIDNKTINNRYDI